MPGVTFARRRASTDHFRSSTGKVPSNVVLAISNSTEAQKIFTRLDPLGTGRVAKASFVEELSKCTKGLTAEDREACFECVSAAAPDGMYANADLWSTWCKQLAAEVPCITGEQQWNKVKVGKQIPGTTFGRRKESKDRGVVPGSASHIGTASTRVRDQLRAKVESMEKMFMDFDANKNGVLSDQELRAGLASLDISLSDAEFVAMFNDIDRNHDGVLQFDEVKAWLVKPGEGTEWETVHEASYTPSTPLSPQAQTRRTITPLQVPVHHDVANKVGLSPPAGSPTSPSRALPAVGSNWLIRGGAIIAAATPSWAKRS